MSSTRRGTLQRCFSSGITFDSEQAVIVAKQSETILVVLTPDLPAIWRTEKLLTFLAHHGAADNVRLILNRTSKKDDIRERDIERLLTHPRCEVFITFMVDAINRFLDHPKDSVVQHIVDAFGTDEATRIAETPGNRIERLRTLYQSRLQRVAEYVRYFEMRDRQDRPQYYLFFATNRREKGDGPQAACILR